MGYTLFRRDRVNRTHGGLLVYVRSPLPAVRRTDLECSTIECIALNVTIKNQSKILLFFCYRPPDFSPSLFFSTLSNQLAKPSEQSLLILLGYLNAKNILWDKHSAPNAAGTQAAALFDDFALTQVVTSPTRLSAVSTALLWTCLQLTVLTLFSIQKQSILYQIIVVLPLLLIFNHSAALNNS